MKEVIVAENLSRRFGSFTAVDNVSFSIPQGSIFGFLGPNGSGKSTVIRMLCGILMPSAGKASVLGYDICSESEKIRENIGYMSQKFSLYTDLSVHENITFYARLYGLYGKNLSSRREEVIQLVGIQDHIDKLAGNLSGGWKQRLALACSLIHQPKVIFLDEPTAGIDPVARRKLWNLIFQLSAQGITFFVTTHYMDEAERCSQVAYIYNSHLIVCGIPENLKNLPEITPCGMKRMEVSCDDTTHILNHILTLPYIEEATIFGQAIHTLLSEEITTEQLRNDILAYKSLALEIREIRPTLEDVFVRLCSIQRESK